MRKKITCYMCDDLGIKSEHVPPKSFFPEGSEFRKNLFTVPSCDTHNNQFTELDEYLRFVLASCIVSDENISKKLDGKIIRSFQKDITKFRTYFKNPEKFQFGKLDHEFFGTVSANYQSIEKCLDKIGRGLYYWHFKKKWLDPILIFIPFIKKVTDPEYNMVIANFEKILVQKFAIEEKYGENPQVFYYQVHHDTNANVTVIHSVFYSGARVFLIFGDLPGFPTR